MTPRAVHPLLVISTRVEGTPVVFKRKFSIMLRIVIHQSMRQLQFFAIMFAIMAPNVNPGALQCCNATCSK